MILTLTEPFQVTPESIGHLVGRRLTLAPAKPIRAVHVEADVVALVYGYPHSNRTERFVAQFGETIHLSAPAGNDVGSLLNAWVEEAATNGFELSTPFTEAATHAEKPTPLDTGI